jgi:hypothetical protein
MSKSQKPAKKKAGAPHRGIQRYTLEVALIGGPVSETFAKKNPEVSRDIQIRGDQTLDDLHEAIFDAFDREEEHLYEFQFGKRPMDPKAQRYVPRGTLDDLFEDGPRPQSSAKTKLDSLALKPRRRFFYWFDFGDDWMHAITVKAVGDAEPGVKYPRVAGRVGPSPPQYPFEEDEDDEDSGEMEGAEEVTEERAADVSCLIGEQHLRDGDFAKAVEAFTRSLETEPSPDAFAGRARAYRALAEADERAGQGLDAPPTPR